MSKLSRYTLFHFLNLLLITVVSLIFLFLVIDYVEKTSTWANRPGKEILSYYLNFIPHILYLITPISIIIASVFSLGRLSAGLEITAMRSAGISTLRIFTPILIFGLLLSCFMLFFVNDILPEANHKRFQILQPKNRSSSNSANFKSNFIYIAPEATFYFKSYYVQKQTGSNISILFKENSNLTQIIDANKMEWNNNGWLLKKGTVRLFKKNKEVKTTAFISKFIANLNTKPTDFVGNRNFPDEMSLTYLRKKINTLKLAGESYAYFETQWHLKIANCFVSFIMLILGLCLSINTVKTGLGKRFGLVILIFFAYFICVRIFVSFGENSIISAFHAAWMACYFFGGASLILLLKTLRS